MDVEVLEVAERVCVENGEYCHHLRVGNREFALAAATVSRRLDGLF